MNNTQLPRICVIGCGYIGLPTVAMFAKHGCSVVGVDAVSAIVDKINRGEIHIEEPGLADLIGSVVEKGLLRASNTPVEADVFIVAVPTPNLDDELRSCDLTYVMNAVTQILPYLRKANCVIVESTIAPRSMDDFVKPAIEGAGFVVGEDIYLAHCPERVLPGRILTELRVNNRIVGGITPQCADRIAQIYEIFVEGEIIKTTARTAEMSKCMENTFRDVNIALANELAKICDRLDINCLDVIALANKHPRVNILSPGPGVGGHCLAVDPYFISSSAPDVAKIIRLARDTNNGMPDFVAEKAAALVKDVERPKIAVLGVTYKGNTDDRRQSPAADVIARLKEKGFDLAICDDHVADPAFHSLPDAAKDASLMLVLTDHDEYKKGALHQYAALMKRPVIFDTRNVVDPGEAIELINFGNLSKY